VLSRAHLKPADPATAQAALDWPARLRQLAQTARDPRLQAFYAAGIAADLRGERPVSELPLVALDLETTGLDPVRDGIVSVGLVPMEGGIIRTSQARQWVVRPRVPFGDESMVLHGITHTQIEEAPDLEAVLGELLQALAGRVVVAHCVAIERQFLARALLSRLGEGIEFPAIDTMALEARWREKQTRPFLDRLLGRRAPPISIRLAASRQRHGLPRYGLHHAATDALACAELLHAQLAHRQRGGETPLRALWC
jgi:DNA polymerase-3 subunit epsilon